MASSAVLHNLFAVSPPTPNCYRSRVLILTPSQFLSSRSLSGLVSHFPKIGVRKPRSQKSSVYAAQSNFFRVLQTVWRVGKDGVEAGTNMVPDAIPRPIARISVTVAALSFTLFVLKSFLSTAFFVLATMGLVYFIFIAFNKDQGPRGGGGSSTTSSTTSTEDAVEEANRIMEKYK